MANLFQVMTSGFGLLLCSTSLAKPSDAHSAQPPEPAKLSISGYGPLGNRQLKRTLRTLELAGKKPEFFAAAFVEDAALIINSRAMRDGFLKPRITIQMEAADGKRLTVTAEELLENPLDRSLRLRQVHFRIRKGVLYHYQNLQFERLESIREKQARSYFVETRGLLALKANRIYTPEKLRHGLSSLTGILSRQ